MIKKLVQIMILAIALIAFNVIPAMAQYQCNNTPPAVISGWVYSELPAHWNGIPNIPVYAYNPSDIYDDARVYTNSSGYYEFTMLNKCTFYWVAAEDYGVMTPNPRGVITNSTQFPYTNINFGIF